MTSSGKIEAMANLEKEPIPKKAKRYTRQVFLLIAAAITSSSVLAKCTGNIGGLGEYEEEDLRQMLKPNSSLQERIGQTLTEPKNRKAVLTYFYPLPAFLSMTALAIWLYHQIFPILFYPFLFCRDRGIIRNGEHRNFWPKQDFARFWHRRSAEGKASVVHEIGRLTK